jgi:hypothetical protein
LKALAQAFAYPRALSEVSEKSVAINISEKLVAGAMVVVIFASLALRYEEAGSLTVISASEGCDWDHISI